MCRPSHTRGGGDALNTEKLSGVNHKLTLIEKPATKETIISNTKKVKKINKNKRMGPWTLFGRLHERSIYYFDAPVLNNCSS
jgi:hypothetical protein